MSFGGRSHAAEAYPFDPPGALEGDDVRIVVLIAAVAPRGRRVHRRIPRAPHGLERQRCSSSARELAGSPISWIAGVNLALLALSILLLLAATAVAMPRIPFARVKPRIVQD